MTFWDKLPKVELVPYQKKRGYWLEVAGLVGIIAMIAAVWFIEN